jgi:hypothetical protein
MAQVCPPGETHLQKPQYSICRERKLPVKAKRRLGNLSHKTRIILFSSTLEFGPGHVNAAADLYWRREKTREANETSSAGQSQSAFFAGAVLRPVATRNKGPGRVDSLGPDPWINTSSEQLLGMRQA